MEGMPLDITVLGVKITDVPYHMEVEVDENEQPVGEPSIVITEETKVKCRAIAVMAKKSKKKVVKYAGK